MTTPSDHGRRARFGGWKNILLVISLAFNLIIAGLIIAHRYFDPGGFHRRMGGPGFAHILPRKFFHELDRDRRNELIGQLKQHKRALRTHRRVLAEQAGKVADALEADPYDAAALDSALATFAGKAKDMMDEGAGIATGFFAKLTPDERKLLARQIRKRAARRRHKTSP